MSSDPRNQATRWVIARNMSAGLAQSVADASPPGAGPPGPQGLQGDRVCRGAGGPAGPQEREGGNQMARRRYWRDGPTGPEGPRPTGLQG
jgi:hypothetical protein